MNTKKWIFVLKNDPTKMNGYVTRTVLLNDIFTATLKKTTEGYVKTVYKRPVESRKYVCLEEFNPTKEELNNLIQSLTFF